MENTLGVMLDCSRNAVMTVDAVKRYAELIKKMGYNTLMLYTEDTYEVNNQPYFGHLRGRYSKDEIKKIDEFCNNIGIELVPCIQTLAHLENMFKWSGEYGDINDCDNILLVDDEKTYALIDDMISSVSQCFTSRKIHIGMDEAYRVGTGKYQMLHGTEDRFDIINRHLHRVCSITDKYGFEPMIWSDMFCKLALNIEDQYMEADTAKIIEKAELPQNISLVYWDYYSTDYNRYAKQIKTNKMFGRKVYFAGGAWTWKGFAPDNDFSIKTSDAAIRACNDCGVDGMLFTVWGDDGAECSPFAVLPSLLYAAEAAKGNTDMDSIKDKFKKITGCDFDSFMLLDKLDKPDVSHNYNPSKYLLYNDLFMGIRDCRCTKGIGMYYKELAGKIHNIENKGEYFEMFDSYEKLANVLAVKAELGIKTREAYLKKDTPALKELIKEYDILVDRLKEFHETYQKRWFKENKPHGFDVQDIRLGGLLQRVLSCKKRLTQLICDEISEIPELEEPVLEGVNGPDYWARIITANSIAF